MGSYGPLSLGGVGGWFGAQEGLRDAIARQAEQVERARQEQAAQLAQLSKVAEIQKGMREFDLQQRKFDQDVLQYNEGAGKRKADLDKVLTDIEDTKGKPEAARLASERQLQNQIALQILQGSQADKRQQAGFTFQEGQQQRQQTFTSGQNALDRSLSRENAGKPVPFVTPFGVVSMRPQGGTMVATPIADPNDPTQTLQARPTLGNDSAYAYWSDMRNAAKTMNQYEGKLSDKDLAIISTKPFNGRTAAGEMVLNSALSADGQAYMRALRNFIESQKRQVSGAAIRPDEYETGVKQYARQTGDSPLSIELARAARANAVVNNAIKAGPTFAQQEGGYLTPERRQKMFDDLTGASAAAIPPSVTGRFKGLDEGDELDFTKADGTVDTWKLVNGVPTMIRSTKKR